MVIWLVGLSGAGKSAIGQEVAEQLRRKGETVAFLDGDQFRDIMSNDLGHSISDRKKNAERMSKVCKWLSDERVTVVCAILCIFPEILKRNRGVIREYTEVFIDAPLKTLEGRDPKGLYRRARANEIDDLVGVHIPFPRPENPDLTIVNDSDDVSPQAHAETIVEWVMRSGQDCS